MENLTGMQQIEQFEIKIKSNLDILRRHQQAGLTAQLNHDRIGLAIATNRANYREERQGYLIQSYRELRHSLDCVGCGAEKGHTNHAYGDKLIGDDCLAAYKLDE
jgi:hypothetical protein